MIETTQLIDTLRSVQQASYEKTLDALRQARAENAKPELISALHKAARAALEASLEIESAQIQAHAGNKSETDNA